MTTTTIRATCSSCQRTTNAPSTSLILILPAAHCDLSVLPTFLYLCPNCRSCEVVSVTWRTAAYLLAAGTTRITAPDPELVRPRYPEQRPAASGPMTLDDLIDLYADLATLTAS